MIATTAHIAILGWLFIARTCRRKMGADRRVRPAVRALALVSSLVCTACGSSGESISDASATFERGGCPVEQAAVLATLNATCGTLTAPQDRSHRSTEKVQLPVTIIPSMTQPAQSDPIVYMAGGPGANAIAQAPDLVKAGLNARRDLIIMNQRGVAYTLPNLACPEVDDAMASAVSLPHDSPQHKALHVAATKACHDRLVAQGIELRNFNTIESEADLVDLRKALKIGQWNLYGLSYGTDLALSLIRDHPEGIRSVIIDAVLPPSVVSLGWTWTNANEAVNNIFRTCASQPSCAAKYGDLASQFTTQVQKLEANPLTMTVTVPGTETTTPVVLDGGAILNWIGSLPDPVVPIPSVPAAIHELVIGHPQKIAEARAVAASPVGRGMVGYGLMYSVICSEWVPFEPASGILSQGRSAFPAYPETVLSQPPGLPFMTEDCAVWNVPRASSSVRQVTNSSIPTLVLNGSFDGKSAPQWGIYAASTLSNATVITVPGSGHGALFQVQLPTDTPARTCIQNIVASFLSNPVAPDTRCGAVLTDVPFDTSH
ncbi:alpha/beta fold hydrolase [Paraburkholderia sp. RL17-373-BIF-A]|uniref:alpha/beta fold hydrolase n=1 Tax=Paraburkholderia sp. RL17-373-BIF-A TaxID=3031629 RepID=UPI0038BA24AD